ncbi:hypothetical protein Dimus_027781 [Dionaea muscipula]
MPPPDPLRSLPFLNRRLQLVGRRDSTPGVLPPPAIIGSDPTRFGPLSGSVGPIGGQSTRIRQDPFCRPALLQLQPRALRARIGDLAPDDSGPGVVGPAADVLQVGRSRDGPCAPRRVGPRDL